MTSPPAPWTPVERLFSLFTRLRPGEGRALLLFAIHAFLLLASLQIVKALREAFMLSKFSAETRSYAVALMAKGWKEAPARAAPGFPKTWTVKAEGFNAALFRHL